MCLISKFCRYLTFCLNFFAVLIKISNTSKHKITKYNNKQQKNLLFFLIIDVYGTNFVEAKSELAVLSASSKGRKNHLLMYLLIKGLFEIYSPSSPSFWRFMGGSSAAPNII